MNIIPGRTYRTRNNVKVFIIGLSSLEDNYIGEIDLHDFKRWKLDGKFTGFDRPHSLDIIEEWREPVSDSITLYLLQHLVTKDVSISINDESKRCTCYKLIGRKRITIIEGDDE